MFEAFAVGPFLIWTRVVFLLLGAWLSAEFLFRLARSARLSLGHFKDRWYVYLGAFLLFGRIVAIVSEYRVYMRDPLRMLIVWDGGFSFLGAMFGIGVVLFWLIRDHRSTFLQWLYVPLPAATFGLVFDWLGKFTAGQAYGIPSALPWAISYDAMNVRYTVPLHPVQLYYALFFFILTFVLLVIRRYSRRAGAETLWGICIATTATFLLENLRGDFSIPVFATHIDLIVLIALFISLGVFAAIELSLSATGMYLYSIMLLCCIGLYLSVRSWLQYPTFEMRFSQFLAVLAILGTVVYVVVHRRKYPHL